MIFIYILILRYGHSSIKVTEDDIIVIGGYGKSFGSCHKRLDDIIQLKILGDGSVSTSKLNIEGTGPGRLTKLVHFNAV